MAEDIEAQYRTRRYRIHRFLLVLWQSGGPLLDDRGNPFNAKLKQADVRCQFVSNLLSESIRKSFGR